MSLEHLYDEFIENISVAMKEAVMRAYRLKEGDQIVLSFDGTFHTDCNKVTGIMVVAIPAWELDIPNWNEASIIAENWREDYGDAVIEAVRRIHPRLAKGMCLT